MKNAVFFTVMTALIALALTATPTHAQDQNRVKADRTPLTYQDSGLYSRVSSIHGPPTPWEDGVTNLLTPQRAASKESPWSFYIMQHNSPASPDEIDLIQQMARNGKKVILRVSLGKLTKSSPQDNIDDKEQHLIDMLAGIDPDWLYAITLDEERVYWDGWANVLTALYHRAKQHWPQLPVYQWWTPMEVPNVRANSGWVALPADGWVIDLYGRPRDVFEKKLLKALETGKPVIHIVWSSPTWIDLTCMGADSWLPDGRQIFDDQLDVCRSYNVPVAHFCTQPPVNQDDQRIAGFRWGWHSVEPELRQWYRYIEVLAENNRYLPDTQLGFRTMDQALFDWAHANERPLITFSLDQRQRKQVTCHIPLSNTPASSGVHQLPLGPVSQYLNLTCTLDQSAHNLDQGLAIAGKPGGVVSAVALFKITPSQPISALQLTANLTATRALGGSAEIALSPDAQQWSQLQSADPDKTRQSLTVTIPGMWQTRFSDQPWYLRVTLNASSGTKTRTAAQLNNLEITAAVEPSLN